MVDYSDCPWKALYLDLLCTEYGKAQGVVDCKQAGAMPVFDLSR